MSRRVCRSPRVGRLIFLAGSSRPTTLTSCLRRIRRDELTIRGRRLVMVPRRLCPPCLAILVLLGPGLLAAKAAPMTFTGYVTSDFNPTTNPNVTVTPVSSDPMNIGQSQWITNNGWVSGWSIKDIRTYYDQVVRHALCRRQHICESVGPVRSVRTGQRRPEWHSHRLRPGPSGRRQVDRPGLCTDQCEQPRVSRNAAGDRRRSGRQVDDRHRHRRLHGLEVQSQPDRTGLPVWHANCPSTRATWPSILRRPILSSSSPSRTSARFPA